MFSLTIVLAIFGNLLSSIVSSSGPPDHHAKLILIDDKSQRFELSGRKCHGGVFFTQPTKFKCACAFGVWGVYGKYCEQPVAILAGQNECFKIPEDMQITQFIIFGNPDYPFEPVITHFREDYTIFTNYYASDTRALDLDPSAPFITITSHLWELESDTGEAICLAGQTEGTDLSSPKVKQFCYYHTEHWAEGQDSTWNLIVSIRKGCRPSTAKQYSTNCVDIPSNPDFPRENGLEVCNGAELLSFPNNTRSDPPVPRNVAPVPEPIRNGTTPAPLVDFPEPLPNMTSTTPKPMPNSSSTEPPKPIFIDFPDPTTSDISTTTTEEPKFPDTCATGIKREDVKAYWSSDEVRECPKNITNAVFVNQLQRIAAQKMTKLFPEKLTSLIQFRKLFNLILTLMTKTCPEQAMSAEFLNETAEAFEFIVEEDFFYGVEELQQQVFERFTTALQNCVHKASTFNFSMEKRECSFEITGNLLLNGTFQKIEIPETENSEKFEPVIEAAWKMFLNAHAYCYEDFQPINDHHHFAVFFFSVFSQSIYEQWNSPLDNTELYKFVLPSGKNLEMTMKNVDYCVGATSLISSCQTWLQRTSAQEILDRPKRSVWDDHMTRARDEARIWNGLGHCLHSPEEPAFKLGYAKCSHPV